MSPIKGKNPNWSYIGSNNFGFEVYYFIIQVEPSPRLLFDIPVSAPESFCCNVFLFNKFICWSPAGGITFHSKLFVSKLWQRGFWFHPLLLRRHPLSSVKPSLSLSVVMSCGCFAVQKQTNRPLCTRNVTLSFVWRVISCLTLNYLHTFFCSLYDSCR